MKRHVFCTLAFLALTGPSLAQEAPTPHKSPRMPVHRESLTDHKTAAPPSREVQGQALIIDGEKLRVGDLDLRLFGVVPPQLSASFGPQARAALDELIAGQNVTCLIRDRDREERFLATCTTANKADLALELLRRGLAVTARGSLATTDLAASYIAAEQAAAAQKAGLWSVGIPAPVVVPETVKTSAPAAPVTPVAATVQAGATPAHTKTAEEKPAPAAVKSEQNQANSATEIPVRSSATVVAASSPSPVDSGISMLSGQPRFLERYQLLVTGLVMLMTALGIFGAIVVQRLRDRRAEMQAIAAALRGELMAARAVCLARIRSSAEAEDRDIAWPRIRSTLYQAYVGRLGWLGAELARRIASIYGQASDYAAYYDGVDESRAAVMPKRQALQALAQHIEDVLPRLAIVEHTGNPAHAGLTPSKPAAVTVSAPPQPAALPESSPSVPKQPESGETAGTPSSVSTMPSPGQLWTAMRKVVNGPWANKKPAAIDPIAEYTALIEEEMKRFSFTESEDESEPSSEGAPNNWPHKAQGAL